MRSLVRLACLLLVSTICLFGCASIPGKTGKEQAENTDALVDRTLSDLYMQKPKTKAAIANSVGYSILSGNITKVPFVGAGSGYGVAINNKTGEKTYLEITRFDVGGGYGVRSVRIVIIFQNEKKFRQFIKGAWSMKASAEASAKVQNSGATGEAGSGDLSGDKGYTVHIITDTGVSVTWTVGVFHVKPVMLKE